MCYSETSLLLLQLWYELECERFMPRNEEDAMPKAA